MGVVTVEVGEGAGFVAEGAEGEGSAACGVVFLADFGFLARHFVVEEGGLGGEEAEPAPAGGDKQIDEPAVDGGCRLELVEIGLAEGAEVVLGLVWQDDLAGAEAVGDGGGPAAGESLGGFGTAGAGAVGAGRIDTALGRHLGSLLERG